jgi:hypothetical protein
MKIFQTLLILLFSGILNAQNFVDLANVYWRTSPSSSIEGSTNKVDFNTWAMDAKAPIVLSEKLTLLPGFELTNNRISNSTDTWIFSSTTLQLGAEMKWTDQFKSVFMFTPKLSSTFTGGVDSKDLQFGGVILNTKRRNENFDWRFGAYVNGELFSVMIVPLLGFNWKINDAWRLKTLIPVNLELSRIMHKKWIAGLLFIGANASYRMRQQLNPFTTFPGNYQPYLDKADNNAWIYSDIYLTKNIVLNLKAGYSVLRKYRFYDEDDKLGLKLGPVNLGNDRADSPALMNNGFSFEGRLIFRLGLK